MSSADALLVHDNRRLRLTFWPGCGGRLIGIEIDGVQLLWRNPDYISAEGTLVAPKATWRPLDGTMGSWANVGGSKTWPAPQGWDGPGQWPGPPDGVLDSGEWELDQAAADGITTLTLISPPDPRSGLQITRVFRIPDGGTGFAQDISFVNVGHAPVRWSIWEVCQADTETGGDVVVTVADSQPPTVMLDVVGQMPTGWPEPGARRVPIIDVVGKLGFSNASGSVCLTRRDGAQITIRFEPVEGAEYPDGGARVELWNQYPIPAPLEEYGGLHPSARLIELEVLGPLVTLQPGQRTCLHLDWAITAPRG
ncbi:MAG: hypothetical protein ACK5KO_11810 [Arachnia sp.]